MKLILKLLITAIALLIVAYIIPGVSVTSFYIALLVALVLGLLNLIVRPILLLLTLPINILTLGLFTLVINALLFWFAASFVQGFSVSGFLPAFIGALLVSVISWLGDHLIENK